MKIMVTGGAGYIGSHTCVELIDAGHEVVIFDNFCNSNVEVVRRIERITGTVPAVVRGMSGIAIASPTRSRCIVAKP